MNPRLLLVDNGSLEPASTLQLRSLAGQLGSRLSCKVDPVSLAHSDRIPADALEGTSAELLDAGLDRCIREGVTDFVIAPLFVGPSHAITRHVPAMIAERIRKNPALRINLVPPLFVPGETRLAEILADHVGEKLVGGERPNIAIVDHGSPARAVTEARDVVTAQVRALLGDRVHQVAACSMERRAGAEFDFNEPLLETLLSRSDWRNRPLIVALMFIGPGRHAGPGGDIVQICQAARGAAMDGVKFTRLMGSHPRLLDILVDRARDAFAVIER